MVSHGAVLHTGHRRMRGMKEMSLSVMRTALRYSHQVTGYSAYRGDTREREQKDRHQGRQCSLHTHNRIIPRSSASYTCGGPKAYPLLQIYYHKRNDFGRVLVYRSARLSTLSFPLSWRGVFIRMKNQRLLAGGPSGRGAAKICDALCVDVFTEVASERQRSAMTAIFERHRSMPTSSKILPTCKPRVY
jgi:hypothetical protein